MRRALRRVADLVRLSEEGWARYANPLAHWTRAPILPLFALAVWSRVWIGEWFYLAVAALVLWTMINPRIFPPVAPNSGWCWRAAMGERLLTERDRRPIPRDHDRMAGFLALLSGVFGLAMAWGLYALAPLATAAATAGAVAAQFWFLERMTWLYEDMQAEEEAEAGAAG